jgi:hypothetical protein
VRDAIVARKGKYELEREHASDFGRRTRDDRVAWNDWRVAMTSPIVEAAHRREAATTWK